MTGVRMTRWTTATTALAAALLLSGCGGSGDAATAEPPGGTSAGEAPAEAAEPALATADSDHGEIVVDADGRTVYVFDEDGPGTGESACTGGCAETWPPVVAADDAPVGEGVDGDLGTLERDDGTLQLTLDGAPLYRFAGDGGPGDVTGQSVDDVWWVVGPDGQKVTKAPTGDPGFSY